MYIIYIYMAYYLKS